MSFEHMPGTVVVILGADCKTAGEVVVQTYLDKERAYNVWWTYPQTGEKELIKVPEWRLQKKENLKPKYF